VFAGKFITSFPQTTLRPIPYLVNKFVLVDCSQTIEELIYVPNIPQQFSTYFLGFDRESATI
jgi:hypothetical protein